MSGDRGRTFRRRLARKVFTPHRAFLFQVPLQRRSRRQLLHPARGAARDASLRSQRCVYDPRNGGATDVSPPAKTATLPDPTVDPAAPPTPPATQLMPPESLTTPPHWNTF